jgi:hypothetical protein
VTPRETASANGAILTLLLVCLHTLPVAAETIRARYSMKYLNLKVGEIATFTDVEASDYRTLLDAHVTGLAMIASSFKTSMKSNGVVRKGLALPNAFMATEASGSSGEHRSEMLLDAGNVRTVDIDPPFDEVPGSVPITEEDKRDVVDPSSALLLPVPGAKPTVGPAACERTLRVFNGTVRFDLSFDFIRTEEITDRAYSGPVSVCSVRFVPIAGYKPSASMIQFMATNRKIEARLAPIAKSRLVVVAALTVPLQIGTAILDLEKLDVELAVRLQAGSMPTHLLPDRHYPVKSGCGSGCCSL